MHRGMDDFTDHIDVPECVLDCVLDFGHINIKGSSNCLSICRDVTNGTEILKVHRMHHRV